MKKLLKRIMALSLCACMMMGAASPASAAEPRLINFSNYSGKTIRVVSYDDPTQELNVLTSSSPYNNCDVTLWPVAQADALHNFVVYSENGGFYSLRCAVNPNYAVELYYGNNNKYNCDVYNTTRGSAYIANEDYFMSVSTLGNCYIFYSLYDDGNGSYSMTVNGTANYGADDVRWTTGLLATSPLKQWTVTIV